MADESKYDPNIIIQAAQDKLSEQNDLEGGQMIFQHALLTWVDDAREQGENETMQQAIVTLWLAYADYLSSAHQYKSAMEAFEQAANCPVAKSVGTIWLTYAQFALERGKKRTAQQVYIRALVGKDGEPPAVQEEQDSDILWQAFLEMMQESNPDLTLAELQQAVIAEQQQAATGGDQKPSATPSSVLSSGMSTTDMGTDEPASKRVKLEPDIAVTSAATEEVNLPPPPPSIELQKTHVLSKEAVTVEAQAFLSVLQQKEVPQDVMAAWMIRDGQSFAQPPEHPLFSPAPPKLSDPTGKSILGVKLALNLNKRLQSTSGTVVLKVCQALWTLTALTEQHTTEAVVQLDKSLKQAHEQREEHFAMKIATATTNSVLIAVKSSVEQDRQAFQRACEEQRQKLLSDIAWQLRRLLCVQQQVLTQLQLPGFSGPTVDAASLEEQAKICAFLHAAFFLRNRIGPDPHLALLAAQAKRLQDQLQEEIEKEARAPPPQQTFAIPPPPPMNQYGAPPVQGYPMGQPGLPQNYYMQQQGQAPAHGMGGIPPPPPPQYGNYNNQYYPPS